jgi:protein-S-isoprenylcysteine O-methyltransferase Ste14
MAEDKMREPASPKREPEFLSWLARRRVPLGFATAIAALVLAQPTWGSWRYGLAVAMAGEAIRVWAAGHLEKSREVTRSGPYRWTRHPLYAGSSVMAAGIVIAARSPALAVLTAIYMVATITAAIRTEEAFLRRTFGDTYDRYSRSEAMPMPRRFSAARALRNREYRAILGLTVGFALLAAKLLL